MITSRYYAKGRKELQGVLKNTTPERASILFFKHWKNNMLHNMVLSDYARKVGPCLYDSEIAIVQKYTFPDNRDFDMAKVLP